jgi:PPM family protein phosphatase
MASCAACGVENRPTARFCWNCAHPLSFMARPTEDDQLWLAATLASPATSSTVAALADVPPTQPLRGDTPGGEQENSMEPETTETPTLFAGRYALSANDGSGRVTATDQQPWRRCWACSSTANVEGEAFCTNCGAALERRSYRAALVPTNDLSGPALIGQVVDDAVRDRLPTLWDQVTEGEQTLVLIADSGRGPVSLPLSETAALRVGVDLSQLLVKLHEQGLALGKVSPADLELNVAGHPQLRDVPGLHTIPADERETAVASDLLALAGLLEALTDTPRTTQRFSEDEPLPSEPGLSVVLRDVRTGTITTPQALVEKLDVLLAERTRPLPLRHIVGAATDVGIVREHNEDSYLVLNLNMDNNSQPRVLGCYIVSDGMGGHAAGEVASGLAIRGAADVILSEYFARSLSLDEPYAEEYAKDVTRRAALQANEYVVREGRARGNDMGATLTMALVVGDRVTVANIGDSRTYLYRDGKLSRISKDHSLVMRLVELGQIRDEDIYTHPQRNAVLRSLGDKENVEVDIFSERVKPGDGLLLLSDGQWEMTRDAEMERMLARDEDPTAICKALVQAANQAGGEDNITAVFVRFAAS